MTVIRWSRRVTAVETNRRLALRAEIELPGEALLEFTVEPEAGGSRLTQTARFLPTGLAGLVYWHGVRPLHAIVFSGMIRGIRDSAVESKPGA